MLDDAKKQLKCRSCYDKSIDGGEPKALLYSDNTPAFTCSKANNANEHECPIGVEECYTLTTTFTVEKKKVTEKLAQCKGPTLDLTAECKKITDKLDGSKCEHTTCKTDLCNGGLVKGVSTVLLTAVLALVTGLF